MTKTANNTLSANNSTGGSVPILGLLNNINIEGLTRLNQAELLERTIAGIAEYLHAGHAYLMLKNKENQLDNIAAVPRNNHDDSLVTASNTLINQVMETATGILCLSCSRKLPVSYPSSFDS